MAYTDTKARVFQLLRAKGASKAVVRFSGGNDEGGVDSIELILPLANGEEAKVDLPVYHGSYMHPGKDKTDDQDLSDLLGSPVDDRYGSFAGDFEVYGTVVWDVAAATATFHQSYSEPRYVDSEEDL